MIGLVSGWSGWFRCCLLLFFPVLWFSFVSIGSCPQVTRDIYI